jgi:hypothetical protein
MKRISAIVTAMRQVATIVVVGFAAVTRMTIGGRSTMAVPLGPPTLA